MSECPFFFLLVCSMHATVVVPDNSCKSTHHANLLGVPQVLGAAALWEWGDARMHWQQPNVDNGWSPSLTK